MSKKGTIMVFSGDMDKVLIAFIIATGFAAMGMEMKMWFTIWGANCLKKRRGLLARWLRPKGEKSKRFRRPDSDTILQDMVEILNRGGPAHLPLSRLNLFGLGPIILNQILKRKKIPTIEEIIPMALELGITFTICQLCVDILALDVNDLIISDFEVKGVSQYMKDVSESHFNIFV